MAKNKKNEKPSKAKVSKGNEQLTQEEINEAKIRAVFHGDEETIAKMLAGK